MSGWDDVEKWAEEQRKKQPPRVRPNKEAGLSAEGAYTAQAEARIANGFHPFGLRLREPRGETCGTCKHLVARSFANTYFKCALRGGTGRSTDIRKKWPACLSWEAKS